MSVCWGRECGVPVNGILLYQEKGTNCREHTHIGKHLKDTALAEEPDAKDYLCVIPLMSDFQKSHIFKRQKANPQSPGVEWWLTADGDRGTLVPEVGRNEMVWTHWLCRVHSLVNSNCDRYMNDTHAAHWRCSNNHYHRNQLDSERQIHFYNKKKRRMWGMNLMSAPVSIVSLHLLGAQRTCGSTCL